MQSGSDYGQELKEMRVNLQQDNRRVNHKWQEEHTSKCTPENLRNPDRSMAGDLQT